MNRKTIGVNYIGYFNEPCGITEASHSNVNALKSIGIDVNVVSYLFNHKRDSYNYEEIGENKKHSINIFHINIGTIKKFIKDLGKKQFKDSYNIAFWAWEFMEIPKDILPYISYFDEIWTPSGFCVKAFSKVSNIPVISMPHAIKETPSNLKRIDLNIPEDKFVFLTIFDSYSAILRKNPYAVVKSFLKSFKNNDDVYLIIKSLNLSKFKEDKEAFDKITSENSNILTIDKRISKTELSGLIENCDSLISLHRSEGFGLTLAEAMSFKKPVIATGYSGNLEFMNVNNSFLVKYNLKPLEHDNGQLKKGYYAADADIEHAASIMKEVYSNKDNSFTLAAEAQKNIAENFSLDSIGLLMKNRLELVSKTKKNNSKLLNKILRK